MFSQLLDLLQFFKFISNLTVKKCQWKKKRGLYLFVLSSQLLNIEAVIVTGAMET